MIFLSTPNLDGKDFSRDSWELQKYLSRKLGLQIFYIEVFKRYFVLFCFVCSYFQYHLITFIIIE